jgi:uncharacterized membrane protein
MRKTHIGLLLLAVAAFGSATAAHDGPAPSGAGHNRPAFVFTSIDVPGAASTRWAGGVNSRGDLVGAYRDSSGKTHGYLLSDGVFTTIDYPGAVYTGASGINARGEIVGAYQRPGERPIDFHGYLRTRDGDFIAIDFPGHFNTIPQRILGNGLILGCRHDDDTMDSMRGVTINARDQSEVTEIDAFGSMHNGATPDGGLIVGFDTETATGRRHGYLLYGDTFVSFVVPGSTSTEAWDVNPRGAVVGAYQDASGLHGFLWEKLRFHAIDYPGATATRAYGINSRGDIVGSYVDAAGLAHGYLASRKRGDGR